MVQGVLPNGRTTRDTTVEITNNIYTRNNTRSERVSKTV